MGGGGISAGMAGKNPPRPGVAEDSVPKPRSFRLLVFNMPLPGSLRLEDANSPETFKAGKPWDPSLWQGRTIIFNNPSPAHEAAQPHPGLGFKFIFKKNRKAT